MFCYDYLTSFDRIFDEGLPARSAFDSELKGTKCSESEYERLKYVWEHYNMKTVKDLLIWYNNLDVQPFVNAILKQQEFYKTFELDMFMDGVSLPGLAEKVMYQTCYDNLETVSEEGIDERYYKRVCFEIEWLFIKIGGYKVGHEYGVETHGKKYTIVYINVFDRHDNRSIFSFTHASDAKYIYNKLVEKFSPKLRFELDTSKVEPPFSFPTNRLEGYKRQDKARGRDFGLKLNILTAC